MPKTCNTSIEAETARKNLFNVVGTNGLEVLVNRTFSDDDNCTTFTELTVL